MALLLPGAEAATRPSDPQAPRPQLRRVTVPRPRARSGTERGRLRPMASARWIWPARPRPRARRRRASSGAPVPFPRPACATGRRERRHRGSMTTWRSSSVRLAARRAWWSWPLPAGAVAARAGRPAPGRAWRRRVPTAGSWAPPRQQEQFPWQTEERRRDPASPRWSAGAARRHGLQAERSHAERVPGRSRA